MRTIRRALLMPTAAAMTTQAKTNVATIDELRDIGSESLRAVEVNGFSHSRILPFMPSS
jgi:hypothetical protein